MIVDSHCHLDYEGLADQLAAVLARAKEQGVGLMLSISSRVKNFPRLLALAEAHENVFCTVGTHPHNAHEELDVTVEQLVKLARHPKVAGLGEAGLDYHYDLSPRDAQMQGFKNHIAAARETGLPLVIHTRMAEEDTARLLEDEMKKGAFKAVLHCFTSQQWLAEKGVELGLYVSFSGILTYKNAEDIRATAKALPLDRILVETDAPFLAPVPFRGKSNEPGFVVKTLEQLAATRGLSKSEMAYLTSANFFRLFDKVPMPHAFRAAA
ncbi:MAG: TatD family hydrolase [Alphaproteobacteria bacterium]|nr:TatD family hydrolase [Alphaproteobacteria bacterium]